MLSDEKSNIFRVRNSYWYGQFFSTELWTGIQPHKTYNISGYGIRIAAIGVYPNITHATIVDSENTSSDHKKHFSFSKLLHIR